MPDSTRTLLFGPDSAVLGDRSFQVVLAVTTIGTMGVAPLSPILDALTQPYGVSETRVGLMLSAYAAPGILFIPLARVQADRYGRRPVMIAGLLVFGAAGSALALTPDFGYALGLRFLQGIGYAAIIPVSITVVGDLYAGTTETTAQGLRFSFTGLSQTVFPPVTGLLVLVGWQYPFAIYLLSFPVALLVYTSFQESHGVVGEDDRSIPGTRETLGNLVSVATHRRVYPILLARGLPEFLYLGFFAFVSTVVRLSGGGAAQAGVLVAVASVCFAGAASQSGRFVAALPGTVWVGMTGAAAIWIGLSTLAFSPSVAVAAAGVAVLGAGIGVSLTLYRSLLASLASADQREVWSASARRSAVLGRRPRRSSSVS